MMRKKEHCSNGFFWTVLAVAAGIMAAAGIAALIYKLVLHKRGCCCGCEDEDDDEDEFEDWDEFAEECDCDAPCDPDAEDCPKE